MVEENCCFIVPLLWRRETRATEGIMTLTVQTEVTRREQKGETTAGRIYDDN